MDEFDYIVVGGGSAGCVVAGELAQDPSLRVLLIECGDRAEDHPETLRADQYKKAFVNEALMFDRYSVPQRHCKNAPIFVGTGRGLGGSGSVNAMVYTRGAVADYAEWPSGWRFADLAPSFDDLERKLRIAQMPPGRFTEACVQAACASGFRFKDDLNDGALAGFLGYNWMNVDGADRMSSYAAFVKPLLGRPNLAIETRATARRVLFDGGRRAVGVEWERDGRVVVSRARGEVVLAAGALETPRLLMRSGVGPGDALRARAVELVHENRQIGENLMDHPNVQIFYRGRQANDCGWAQLYGFHRADPSSAPPPGEADSCFVFYAARTSFREGVVRLVPGMVLPPSLYRVRPLTRALRRALAGVLAVPPLGRFIDAMWGIVVILGKPRSRGTVTLDGVDPNYFGDPRDLATMVKGVRLARRIAAAPSLAAWGNFELMPGRRAASDEKIARFIRQNAMTTYHFAGTCRMGEDDAAPVTPRLEVRGVRGLRVADASVIPSVPVSAMNAPSMVIGRRCADLLREARAARENEKGRRASPSASS